MNDSVLASYGGRVLVRAELKRLRKLNNDLLDIICECRFAMCGNVPLKYPIWKITEEALTKAGRYITQNE